VNECVLPCDGTYRRTAAVNHTSSSLCLRAGCNVSTGSLVSERTNFDLGDDCGDSMPHSAEPSKPQVLCVDDDLATLELLSRHLLGLCEVSTVSSGEAALAVLSQAPDLAVIVSDMNMPRMPASRH
jgi:hypothetical protein